ncbi:MAG: site-specific integrase [Verrucomicrobiales bacterium]
MDSHKKTAKNEPERPASGQPLRLAIARTSVAYWKKKVHKPMGRGGVESPHYSARIGHQKRRIRFPLYTPNKEKAATMAAHIFAYLLENGWDATLAKYKPQNQIGQQTEEKVAHTTVGALIETSRRYSTAREQSFNTYIKAFRRIVSSVMKIDHPSRASRKSERESCWQDQVDSVPLSDLTPARIQSWKKEFLEIPRDGAKERKQAIITLNSLIRNSKALFAKKLLPFLHSDLQLPSPLPFDQVSMEKPPSQRYHSQINARKILKDAHENLKNEHVEAYKILLLALICGLRVSEIDHLLWSSFNFAEMTLIIQDTQFHRLKSEDSAGVISLSGETRDIFSSYFRQATGAFVIEAKSSASPTVSTSRYRCQQHLNILKNWLRSQGVTATKPIHELRKEVGSIIASEDGIFAASRYLRHSDIRITSSIYADQKKRITPSIAEKL